MELFCCNSADGFHGISACAWHTVELLNRLSNPGVIHTSKTNLCDRREDFNFPQQPAIKEIVIGTTSSEISDQLRDRYSICKCCLNVATYINGKFTMGKLKSSLLSQRFVFDVCITPGLLNLFNNSTVCHAHADRVAANKEATKPGVLSV
jgi:hypothetical protein